MLQILLLLSHILFPVLQNIQKSTKGGEQGQGAGEAGNGDRRYAADLPVWEFGGVPIGKKKKFCFPVLSEG